jgi:hypothetical protein
LTSSSSFRYRHFIAKGGKSPFDRGAWRNLIEFLECGLFGLVKPQTRNWLTFFWNDLESDDDKSIEVEPLLRATDNYQYV